MPYDTPPQHIADALTHGPDRAYLIWASQHQQATTRERWEIICDVYATDGHITASDHQALINQPPADGTPLDTPNQAIAVWRATIAELAGLGVLNPEVIWAARDLHQHLHRWAKHQTVSPWGVLGATLTRVVTAVPPTWRLPGIRGPLGVPASLNLLLALVGPPGAGKNLSMGVSRAALEIEREPPQIPLGSGEGLSHMFTRRPRPTKDDPEPECVRHRHAVLTTVGEVDAFSAIAGRKSSTLGPQLRAAAMGEELGFGYADPSRRIITPAHTYRLCMIIGVQPRRAAALLSGPELEGGTPQRLLWLPVNDPSVRLEDIDDDATDPPVITWTAPVIPDDRRAAGVARICPSVRRAVLESRVAANRGEQDEWAAHATLNREKVAMALAILDGRLDIEEADWALSGLIVAKSEATRMAVQDELKQQAMEVNERAARAEVARQAITDEARDDRLAKRAERAVLRTLARLISVEQEWVPSWMVKRRMSSNDRGLFEHALEDLIRDGRIVTRCVDDVVSLKLP